MEQYEKVDIRNSIYDGMFANMFATLTGGVFLTGFALHLGMSEFLIGLLASMPFLVTIFQLPTSYFISKGEQRKQIAYRAAAIARLLWIPILAIAFLPVSQTQAKSGFILGLIFLSYTFLSVSYVAWLSWISDLVPDGIRGRFFGTRNMLCGAAGMTIMLIFGNLLDYLNNRSSGRSLIGFGITFLSAVLFGILSLRFLNRMSEPQAKQLGNHNSLRENLSLPFRERNFRKFLIFASLWSFSVYFASPFFTLYFLRDLKFSYGFVAALGVLSALADMAGMHFWGRVSDKVKNKAVIRLAGWAAIFLPLAWVTVRPESLVMPVLLHLIGGGFWAGINLCMNNLLLKISPQENKAWFLSAYNIFGGLGAAAGPILAGFVLVTVNHLDFRLFSWNLMPVQVIFVASTLFRLLSFQMLKYVTEPEEISVGQMIRVLRSVRGLNVATGFNYLLHPFIEVPKGVRKS